MKKALPIVCIVVFLIVSLLGYGFYWAFYNIQRLEGREVLQEVSSPNGTYTVTAYLNNGGATTGYAVLCSVKTIVQAKKRTYTGSIVAPRQILFGWMSKPYKSMALS